jgi:4-amino-4-deoxy-L-arabinose transferase-like glycosyltransferase
MLFGAHSPDALAVAARFPLALAMLALALVTETFARRLFSSAQSGLYAALITLSSPGFFLFSRLTLPDILVCLFLTAALYFFWQTEEEAAQTHVAHFLCYAFAGCCALNVLSKGLIGLVFPLGIVLLYLLLTRGPRLAFQRLGQLHPLPSLAVFLVVAAPWHVLAGLANPTQGHPSPFHFIHGHWIVPLPSDGHVRGWFWFYFMNEHLLRYLNLRVPRDYDTDPLYLFWGLCLVWLLPWTAFTLPAVWQSLNRQLAALRVRLTAPRSVLALYTPQPGNRDLLLLLWAALPLLFFSLSTRQEYYVLPALPALVLLSAGWLAQPSSVTYHARRIGLSILTVMGLFFAVSTIWFLLHTHQPLPGTDLAGLLQQNPSDYALSMGHFLDLNARALGLFRVPLILAATGLFLGPLAALFLLRRERASSVALAAGALAAGALAFLLAVHLGLQTFAPVITSAQLAKQIAPLVRPSDLLVIHGEYEAGSTLGFYLQRSDIHSLEGRSSNLWYGSFFSDAPPIFETPDSLRARWTGPQRIFLWQSLTDAPRPLPGLTPVFVVASGGGKEILSNQPNAW